jgi:hypothetical protein
MPAKKPPHDKVVPIKKAAKKKATTKKKTTRKKRAPRKPKAPPGWKYDELGELVRDQTARKKEIQFEIAKAVEFAKFPIDAELAIINAMAENIAEEIDREILAELQIAAESKIEKDIRPEYEQIKASLLTLGRWLKKDKRRTIVLSSQDDKRLGLGDPSFHAHANIEDTEYDSEDAKDLRHAIELLADELRLG